ncbi:MAG: M1 family metallopeptidase [Planctomycetota bacterium]|nr:M1 family metallopeptidase [Planctomycetota bacterium]
MRRLQLPAAFALLLGLGIAASTLDGQHDRDDDKFAQLGVLLPTPNNTRTASGAPGHEYWQQRVDYVIDVTLDDEHQRILASERVTYHNNSPDTLTYLWVEIDPNIFAPESHAVTTSLAPDLEDYSMQRMLNDLARKEFDGSATVSNVRDADGHELHTATSGTQLRIDLPEPLESGESFVFALDWEYTINDQRRFGGRTGWEHFEEDDNYLYEMAHWFPRLCAYTDYTGWQNKQFLGRGEFTLEFGDYLVRITAPADHVVASTGTLQNPSKVLSAAQRDRLASAEEAELPVFIVTPEEAKANEDSRAEGTKTWEFHARNVRDFAWASSRKFIWDAVRYDQADGDPVWCMSYYPNEAEPLWSRYSTHAIIHTLDVYGKFTFPYPYPVAISVNGPVGGMEYPMICFNGPRPEEDGTYSARTKYGLISVIIHEVGHNWFPMIVNSDERQWTWMDEGLNTFLQYLAEQEWEADYPSRRGEPKKMTTYMTSAKQRPIMTNSESIHQFGNNAYGKPATALNVLRETVMGRELFDFAFKEYANRWRFKRPEPADLFRTLEDASAVDLDWFWWGWFYTTDHCDVAITDVHLYTLDTLDPEIEKGRQQEARAGEPTTLSEQRNKDLELRSERYPELLDFYNEYDPLAVTDEDRAAYKVAYAQMSEQARDLLDQGLHLYVVSLENLGGLVTPVVLEAHFEDGSTHEYRIPAELWNTESGSVKKLLVTHQPVASVVLDPHLETADADLTNNRFPRTIGETRIKLGPDGPQDPNPMQKAGLGKAQAEGQ